MPDYGPELYQSRDRSAEGGGDCPTMAALKTIRISVPRIQKSLRTEPTVSFGENRGNPKDPR